MDLQARWLSLNDVARFLAVSRTTVNTWRELGNFPKPIELGGRVVFLTEEVLSFARQREESRSGQDRVGAKRRAMEAQVAA